LGFKQSIIIFLKKDDRQFSSIFNLSFVIAILITLFLVLSLLIIEFNYELMVENLGFKIIIILILYFSTELLVSYLSSSVLGLNFYKFYPLIFSFNSIIHIAFLLVLLFYSTINLQNALIVLLLKNLLVLFFIIVKVRGLLNFKINLEWDLYFKMVKDGFIYSLALLLLSLIYNSDIIILKLFTIDANDFGVYALTSKIIHGLCILPQSIGTIFFSLSLKKNHAIGLTSKIIISKVFFYIFILSLIILYFLLPGIIDAVLGSAYQKTFDIFLLLMPGVCGLFIIKTLYPDLAGQGQVKPFIFTFFLISVFQLILNLILISKYSVNGCAIACSISYLILAILILKKYLVINKLKLSQLTVLTFNDIKSICYN